MSNSGESAVLNGSNGSLALTPPGHGRTFGEGWRRHVDGVVWSIFRGSERADAPDLLIPAARVFLALVSLVAFWIDRAKPPHAAVIAQSLIVAYLAYSLSLLLLERHSGAWTNVAGWLHAADIAWAAAITLVTNGPNSPFFLYFLFVLLAAAYRWELRRVMLTSAALVVVLCTQAAVLAIPTVHAFMGTEHDLARLFTRAGYILIGGLVVGYVGDNEKRISAEARLLARLVSIPRAELGFVRSVQSLLSEIRGYFEAPRAAILFRAGDGKTYLAETSENDEKWIELTLQQAESWTFKIPATSAWVSSTAGIGSDGFIARWRSRSARGEAEVGAEFVATNPYDDILVSHFAVAGDWSARLLLFDPKPPSNATAALHLVDAIANQITPSIHNIYMLRRIRARAQAAQRSRLAQELHDGAIQSLVAAGLQLEVLRRTLPLPESAVNDIGRVQEVIRSEMYNLRAVVQDLRLRSMPTREISTELTQLVNRFREFTDITVKLTCDRRCDNMAPSVAQELLRIAQEALANVRKHSACKQVAVELKNAGDAVELTVKDDGVGFEFEGQMTLEQLEKTRSGPVTIRQRLRDLGGNLLIESHPGQGSRLSITVPYVVRDADA